MNSLWRWRGPSETSAEAATSWLSAPLVIDTPLPETQGTRSVARLLEADAALRADDGDSDGALDSCRGILATARSIGDEPMLISQLARIAADSVAMKAAQRVLGQGEPSDAACAAASRDPRRASSAILARRHEGRARHDHGIGSADRSGKDSALCDHRVARSPLPLAACWRPGCSRCCSAASSVASRLSPLEWMNEAVAISRRPAFEQRDLWQEWNAKIVAVRQSRFGLFTAMLPFLTVPATSAANSAFMRVQGELGATAILIAAERHRRRTGKWPDSIKAIDPSILPGPPVDPYTGEPFHLEHHDGQLFIYSFGPNGQDEHGVYDLKQWPKGKLDDVGARAWDVNLRRRPEVQADE